MHGLVFPCLPVGGPTSNAHFHIFVQNHPKVPLTVPGKPYIAGSAMCMYRTGDLIALDDSADLFALRRAK